MAEDSPPKTSFVNKLKKVFGYFAIYVQVNPTKFDILLLITGLIFAIASGVPFPLLGIIFGQLIDDFNSESCTAKADYSPEIQASYQSEVNSKILYVLYLAIAQFGFMYIQLVCWSLGGARLAQRLREQYFRSMLRQEPSFFDDLPSGEVSSRLNGDISTIRSGTSEKVGICISSVSFFVTSYVVAFIKDSKLAGILVSLVPAYFLMSLVGGWFIEKYSGTMSDCFAAASSVASEGLSNVSVVHAFNANQRLEEKFEGHLRMARSEGLKKALATGVQAGFMYFIAYAANALAFWQGSRTIANSVASGGGGASVGSIFTVIFVLVDATLVLSQVAPFLQIFGAASAAFTKLQRDMNHQSAINGMSDTGLALPSSMAGHFELRNVSFTYPSRPEQQVLGNVSLECPAGKQTAIIGLSGSGKSTVASLMLRLYDPIEGSVLLDGQDVRDLNTRQLRSCIGMVQQEATLLDRSILENIAHGLVNSASPEHEALHSVLIGGQLGEVARAIREGQNEVKAAEAYGANVLKIIEMVQHAAELADAARFIGQLSEGLGTMVGSNGTLLSGGQKQRIAVARALVKDPKVLILDEATASLDSRSEKEILEAVGRCSEGRTMISIAHRLSTIKKADKIIVMRDGGVVEEGNHSELMAKQGAYAALVELQNLNTDSNPPDHNAESDSADITDGEQGTESSNVPEVIKSKEIVIDTTEKPSDSSSEAPAKKTLWYLTKGMLPIMRPYLLIALIALVGASIVGAAFSAEAVIFGNTVGSLTPCETPEYIRSRGNFFGLMFFILAIIEFFANIVSWVGFGWVSEKSIYNVRVLLFRSLFEQDLQWHQSAGRNPTGLLGYITNDGNLIAGLSGSVIGTIFSICINLVVAVVLSLCIAWKIALVCIAVVPLLLGTGVVQLHVLAQFEERHENAFNQSVSISVEAINSIKTIASLSLEEETLAAFRRTLNGPRRETTMVSLHANLWLGLAYFLGNLSYALAFWWGSKQIFNGTYSETQFIIVMFALLVSAQLWSQMFALAPEVSNARAAVARVLAILELGSAGSKHTALETSTEKDLEGTAPTKSIAPNTEGGLDVEFRDVKFSYPARAHIPVLRGLNVHVRPGQFCALVGPSGAGKSTIISLVERMYLPTSGEILVDGTDITKREDISFRDHIALVPQEGVLFEGSVRFNVSLGARPGTEVSDAEIEEACKLANIHETIINLPSGYDTMCGANGSKLSGGQKQRLAIARALVRKPRLLVLDEPTSALDAESEKLLQQGLEVASKGISVLAIAHRLNTIRKADTIYLIEAGLCVDAGTHEELFKRSESYRTNVLSQSFGGE
ncbi:unnamed protein product [Penicillium salamii]|uniref:ABC multidrug transporter MDR2 n=1 Tax=Penicillium salamii TaxID=1612424 RepID=A0A9W4JH55_9EURO|nr:unnamed protein product [Penicillium salamii]CAG8062635.1 unnamed protein product [Penicillium salamii]CAG8139563.1 unnamed protein product [Penicillium salamii]CAG8149075.1 unnamed protein product [Penicillium salamii]CAG8157165.1 unnamed protein product [Penicillium salamii]